jgi:hypothetical protein
MIMRRGAVLACVTLLAGCGLATPPPDTARVSVLAFGGLADPDVAAINLAQWAWAEPSRTHNDPVDGARAVAAVDFLGGELTSSPRWVYMDPITQVQMLHARTAVRQVVGIAPTAPSQLVVNSLLQFAGAYEAGNRPAALAALAVPIYQHPPEQTLNILGNLPYVQIANIATQHAGQQSSPPLGGNGGGGTIH